jgi:hypothetical protein
MVQKVARKRAREKRRKKITSDPTLAEDTSVVQPMAAHARRRKGQVKNALQPRKGQVRIGSGLNLSLTALQKGTG